MNLKPYNGTSRIITMYICYVYFNPMYKENERQTKKPVTEGNFYALSDETQNNGVSEK